MSNKEASTKMTKCEDCKYFFKDDIDPDMIKYGCAHPKLDFWISDTKDIKNCKHWERNISKAVSGSLKKKFGRRNK